MKPNYQLVDLVGQKFGRLTVIERGEQTPDGKTQWVCQCACGGGTVLVRQKDMRNGKVRSCGCVRREMVSAKNFKHGYASRDAMRPEYFVWRGMKERCTSPDCKAYPSYGGRGIGMDPEWMDFNNFIRDMGPRPSPRHSCERKDNSKGYCKDNCCWATQKQQSNNRRSTVRITYQGRTQSMAEWCEELGTSYTAAQTRICNLGWDPIEAITRPVRKINRREHLYVKEVSMEPSTDRGLEET